MNTRMRINNLLKQLNFNPWHDELGRFTTGPGGIGLSSSAGSFGKLSNPKEVSAFKQAINGTWQSLMSGDTMKQKDGKVVDEQANGRYGTTKKEYKTKSVDTARSVDSKLATAFDAIRLGNESLSRAEASYKKGDTKTQKRNLDKAARQLGRAYNVAQTLPKDFGCKITTDKNGKNVSTFETENPYKSVLSLVNTCSYYHDQIIDSMK